MMRKALDPGARWQTLERKRQCEGLEFNVGPKMRPTLQREHHFETPITFGLEKIGHCPHTVLALR
eukprot:8576008-Pyramimonas_sp.AAC.1